MRKFHRWLMLVFGILIAYWVVSGVCLAVIDITDRQQAWAGDGGGPGAITPDHVAGMPIETARVLTREDLRRMTSVTLAVAREQRPVADIAMLELSSDRQQLRGTLSFTDSAVRPIAVNIDTATIIETKAEESANLPPGNGATTNWHSSVKNWHRGNIGAGNTLATIGMQLGLITGIALVLLSASGCYMYLTLYAARRRVKRTEFFWRDTSFWRRLHRWISIVMAVFILNQAITGALLEWFNLTDESRAVMVGGAPASFTDAQLLSTVDDVWRRVQQSVPDAKVIGMVLTHNGDNVFAPVLFGGEHPGAIGFRLTENDYIFGVAGQVGPGGAAADSHSWMKRVHRGDFIGVFGGRFIALSAGLAMAWLLISGLVMYLQSRIRSKQVLSGGAL
ncbi:MAG: PepSY-associated TM helix domain-containing protein [Steroidobacteraceae bacterium]